MVDPKTFFKHGRVPCQRCGRLNDFGSSEALYDAELSTPCVYCGFRFLQHHDRQMEKLKEMVEQDPAWLALVRHGSLKVLKQRLDELVPIPKDEGRSGKLIWSTFGQRAPE